ncbi:hypothetical protein EYF80_058706 [Liparis tanakae]|uniref:Uncharacterized protein n=1 Tax=Liparis tanakae TaxID=230148 RepID=A0A4Z2EQS7_9TELE|nr:hypothetical protein EYF80_058706 [Liparis tanakae]
MCSSISFSLAVKLPISSWARRSVKCSSAYWPNGIWAEGNTCHVMAICTQDWLTSGRVAMIISMVTASLSVGAGCLIVHGVLGTQAHQSNWEGTTRERMS